MNRLTSVIAERCQKHRTEEKWLLAPNLRVGHQWLETVARAGHPVVNVRIKTLKSMAIGLAGPEMAARGVRLSGARAGAFLVDRVLRDLQGSELKYLADVDLSPRMAETALSSIDVMRLAGVGLSDLAGKQFEVTQKGEDLAKILEGYQRLLQAEGMVDYTMVLEMAIERLKRDAACLSTDVLVLVPEDLPRAALETRLLDCILEECRQELAVDRPAESEDVESAKSDRQLLRWLLLAADAPEPFSDGTVRLVRAVGEVNEIRAVLRMCVANGIPWDDVELLHTDTSRYVPLVYETLSSIDRRAAEPEDDLPVTLSEGISCRYSRPGRALTAWLQWMDEDFPQAQLVTMIKEGLINVGTVEEQHSGFTRLAGLLRGVGIGFGRQRYTTKILDAVHSLENKLQAIEHRDEDDEEMSPARREAVRRDLRDMRVLHRLVAGLLEICPDAGAGALEMIAKAKEFLAGVARSVNKLDRFAAASLAQELADMEYWLSRGDEFEVDVHRWLEGLSTETRVMGSGPRPGCLHVDSLFSGGHSGREHTFIVGLDDSRFPGAGLQDPLLLDSERRKLSVEIPTAAGRLEEKLEEFVRLLARLRGTVTLSFSCQSVEEDREMFPSSVVLSVYRIISGDREGDQEDLLKWMPAAASFAPAEANDCLDTTDWWLWRLTGPEQVKDAKELVRRQFPYLARGEQAAAERLGAQFTAQDGYVPQAGEDLDPTKKTGRVMSSNALQTVGRCPREFFFKYGLEITPPEDISIDPEKWLDALAFGSLTHELFEEFVREVIADGRVPQFDADYKRLKQLLQEKISEYRDLYPPLNDAAFQRQVAQLEQTARTFLREDERHCKETNSVPVYLEASIGLPVDGHGTALDTPDPVPLRLPNGKVIRVCGRVDRIDRIGGGAVQTYGIWDYKSGSTWGYDRADPLRQGRKVQPFVYVTIVGHCLKKAVAPKACVEYFGFFFPGVRAVGERLQWTPQELATGGEVLQNLCQLVAEGVFVATNNYEHDCTYCDYLAICGDVAAVSESVNRKLEVSENQILEPFRALRPPE